MSGLGRMAGARAGWLAFWAGWLAFGQDGWRADVTFVNRSTLQHGVGPKVVMNVWPSYAIRPDLAVCTKQI